MVPVNLCSSLETTLLPSLSLTVTFTVEMSFPSTEMTYVTMPTKMNGVEVLRGKMCVHVLPDVPLSLVDMVISSMYVSSVVYSTTGLSIPA